VDGAKKLTWIIHPWLTLVEWLTNHIFVSIDKIKIPINDLQDKSNKNIPFSYIFLPPKKMWPNAFAKMLKTRLVRRKLIVCHMSILFTAITKLCITVYTHADTLALSILFCRLLLMTFYCLCTHEFHNFCNKCLWISPKFSTLPFFCVHLQCGISYVHLSLVFVLSIPKMNIYLLHGFASGFCWLLA